MKSTITNGMKKGMNSWKELLRFVMYFYSMKGLLSTLFLPWHRDEMERNKNDGAWGVLEYVAFQFITRVIGFVARTLVISLGLLTVVFVFLIQPLFMIFPISIKYENLARSFGSIGKSWAYPFTNFLDKHGRDLRNTKDLWVPENDGVIEQIERILSRSNQQNVLLVGDQGVGKTTRLEYLARKMYRDLSSGSINSKRLIELFPEEMSVDDIEKSLHEAVKAGNVVLVIENIERYDILGIISPYFENNNFQMIITTDPVSYNAKFKHNGNLERVAEVVDMYPPNDEVVKKILNDWVSVNGYRRRFKDEKVVIEIVEKTNQLMVNRVQPEKSIDIMEELVTLPNKEITVQDVQRVLSQKTNVPLGSLTHNEKELLLSLEENLQSDVVGQRQALENISDALKRSRAGVKNSKKPIGSFLFFGPTGVGKTHTAKMLAKHYFGSKDRMIRFDMSEYRELDTTDRFLERLGAEIEDTPFSLVFFDEIEKAHPDIINLFLQVLDEGEIHTPSGRLLTFRNSIIICTSNAGSDYLMQNEGVSKEVLIRHIISKSLFRPEFINRFDSTILYSILEPKEIRQIARLMLRDLNIHLEEEKKIRVLITDKLVDHIIRKGYSARFGARPIKRVIQDDIETAIAERFLGEKLEYFTDQIIEFEEI